MKLFYRSEAEPEKTSLPSPNIDFSFSSSSPHFATVNITVPAPIISKMFDHIARSYQKTVDAQGFHRGQVPLEYVRNNYKDTILHHLKEFLFKWCVADVLYQKIREEKIMAAGEPRLIDITMPGNDQDACYTFELTMYSGLTVYDWKYLPFKAPKRKNYKDLDRQVEHFIEEEKERAKESTPELQTGDWVHFSVSIFEQENPVIDQAQHFWLNLGDEEIESPLKKIFIGRSLGEQFLTESDGLQNYLSSDMVSPLTYEVNIVDTVPYALFMFDDFKRYFRIKTNKDMHKKLIEVFSYRHDMSQRRAMVEDALELLIAKHRMTIPRHLVLRQKEILYEMVKENPDYNVYRQQKGFDTQIEELAEKQVREAIFIDKMAYQENICISDPDVKGYLNLIKRPRTKEFIYFTLPSTKLGGYEIPLPSEEIKRVCLREKTVNHILYHLTKK